MKHAVFRFGDWNVVRDTNSLDNGVLRHRIEPRAMDVLVALCERASEVVSAEELLLQCWGSTLHGDNPIHKTVAQLRRTLGDSTTSPIFIETIRKRGYRAIAPVTCAARPGRWFEESSFRGLEPFDTRHAYKGCDWQTLKPGNGAELSFWAKTKCLETLYITLLQAVENQAAYEGELPNIGMVGGFDTYRLNAVTHPNMKVMFQYTAAKQVKALVFTLIETDD